MQLCYVTDIRKALLLSCAVEPTLPRTGRRGVSSAHAEIDPSMVEMGTARTVSAPCCRANDCHMCDIVHSTSWLTFESWERTIIGDTAKEELLYVFV